MSRAGAGPPLIAVMGRVIGPERIERSLEPQCALPTYYLDSLARADGLGVVIPPGAGGDGLAATVMPRFDGLILTGGEDLDPALYGQDAVAETYGFDRAVDEWEIALYREAIALDRPVLAICRGLQLLNVIHSGTLHQHITGASGWGSHGIPLGGGGADVETAVEKGSRLAAALDGTLTPIGRCHHHQAVDEVGQGLRVTARASDGCVEGLEPDGSEWVVAVQWHPEDSAMRDPAQQGLFGAFVAECRSRRLLAHSS